MIRTARIRPLKVTFTSPLVNFKNCTTFHSPFYILCRLWAIPDPVFLYLSFFELTAMDLSFPWKNF
jgi:hypothetical protein